MPGKGAPSNQQFAALDAKLPDAPADKAKACTAKRKGKTVAVPCPSSAKPAGKSSGKAAKNVTKGKTAPAKGNKAAPKTAPKTAPKKK